METTTRHAGWIVMVLLALVPALMAVRYFAPGMPGAFQPDVYPDYSWVIRAHIGAGIVAILAGPMQFWSGFRNRHRAWHRRIGIAYLSAVAIAALGGLVMATVSLGGLVTHAGFGLLALVWGGASLVALRHIRAGNWRAHREWMIRSYAVAFAFVTLRLWLVTLTGLGAPLLEAYQTVSWLCWVPNLIVAELYIGWWRRREAAIPATARG